MYAINSVQAEYPTDVRLRRNIFLPQNTRRSTLILFSDWLWNLSMGSFRLASSTTGVFSAPVSRRDYLARAANDDWLLHELYQGFQGGRYNPKEIHGDASDNGSARVAKRSIHTTDELRESYHSGHHRPFDLAAWMSEQRESSLLQNQGCGGHSEWMIDFGHWNWGCCSRRWAYPMALAW